MGGAYAMGAPWLHFTGRCNPEWGRDLGDWLAKMTGHRSQHSHQAYGHWGMFAGPPLGRRGGLAELVDGALRRRAAETCARRFLRCWPSSR